MPSSILLAPHQFQVKSYTSDIIVQPFHSLFHQNSWLWSYWLCYCSFCCSKTFSTDTLRQLKTVFHTYSIKKSSNAETSTSLFLLMQIINFAFLPWFDCLSASFIPCSSIGCTDLLKDFPFLIFFLWCGLNHSLFIADKILNHFVAFSNSK